MCLGLREKANKDPTLIFRTITGDESYDTETKQRSLQWMSPQSPRAKKGVAGSEFNKEMLIVLLM
jgi:hypothetical protein